VPRVEGLLALQRLAVHIRHLLEEPLHLQQPFVVPEAAHDPQARRRRQRREEHGRRRSHAHEDVRADMHLQLGSP
jgi:hypothetical protein